MVAPFSPQNLQCTFAPHQDRKSTRLNSSHANISYAVFCLKKKKTGMYGNSIANESTQSTSTLGVVHKWLPCGTKVTISYHCRSIMVSLIVFFFNDTATTEIYTLSLHDALPISSAIVSLWDRGASLRAIDRWPRRDRKSTRLNSSHANISYAVFCLKKKKKK